MSLFVFLPMRDVKNDPPEVAILGIIFFIGFLIFMGWLIWNS